MSKATPSRTLVTDDKLRSERQAQASRVNGTRSRGPTSPGGKARSAQNSQKHGLTGTLDPTQAEQQETQRLFASLSSRFAAGDPHIAALVDRVVTATLRLNRARTLITEALEDLADPSNARRAAEQARYKQAIAASTAAPSKARGSKQLARLLARRIAKDSAHAGAIVTPNPSVINKLMQYAQRFRGERDRALARLQQARK